MIIMANSSSSSLLSRSVASAFRGGGAGFCAMLLQVMLLMWLRTVVNYQYTHNVGLMEAFTILWTEGGVPRFYQAFWFALMLGPLCRFGDTASNEGMREWLKGTSLSMETITLCASLTATIWRFILTPIDNLKTNLQVSGPLGITHVMDKIHTKGIITLWDGAIGNWLGTMLGHYPWFMVNNRLETLVPNVENASRTSKLLRRAGIGLCCSIVSDICSNSVRVIKTYKQTSDLSYLAAVMAVIQESGLLSLFVRGLGAKLLVNAISSILFSVVWKSLMEKMQERSSSSNKSPEDPAVLRTTLVNNNNNNRIVTRMKKKGLLQKKNWLFLLVFLPVSLLTVNNMSLSRAIELPPSGEVEVTHRSMATTTAPKRKPRVALFMSNARKCDDGGENCGFSNYGDRLMYLTALQQCDRLGAECKLYSGSTYNDGPELTSFIQDWEPQAAWYLLGYALSSTFGFKKIGQTLKVVRTMKNSGVYVALLPQAVGPFQNTRIRGAAKELFPLFDYIAVRDLESREAIHGVAPNLPVDIIQDTVLAKTLSATSGKQEHDLSRPFLGLSLSRMMKKMMDKNGIFDQTIRQLLSTLTKNATVVLIPHEENTSGSDLSLVRYYQTVATNELGIESSHIIACDKGSLEVETIENLIAELDLLIVMRYHTMVVAIREGKSTAAYSWAAKYKDLLNSAGIGDDVGLLAFNDTDDAIHKIWTLYDKRSEIEPNINAFAAEAKARVDKMYEDLVDAAVKNIPPPPAQVVGSDIESNGGGVPTERVLVNSQPVYTNTSCSMLAGEFLMTPFPLSRNRCPASLSLLAPGAGDLKSFSDLEERSRQTPPMERPVNAGQFDQIKTYDMQRFAGHVATEELPTEQLSHDNLVALILKYQHQLEKGLAMPNRRTQFGVSSGVFAKLKTYSVAFLTRYGLSSEFVFQGLGAAIDQYIGFHKSRGEDVASIVTELRELMISNGVEWKEHDGGILTIDKSDLLQLSGGNFSSLVLARRSIRQYAPRLHDESVEFSQLRNDVFDVVRLASEGTPSVCNRQGVKVALVRDVKKIEAAINIQGGGRGHDLPEYLVMIMSNLQIFREERERNQAYVDGGLFAMSLMYGFQSKGLATCSLNFAATAMKDRKMRKLLEVDDSHVIIMFLAVGRYRDDVVNTVSPRRAAYDLQSIVREIL